ncbi:hypothetical protein [Halorhodospira halochloris]|uniref:hypothetical protein n=1 Tax=Halorhodospira halochloris TaxID=1052 RepID=UPI001EE88040|nr:hypothetical protein [Halorhodospira halochloris]MCG5549313.1 hypothetical protein [Halorhodospira halochloris]
MWPRGSEDDEEEAIEASELIERLEEADALNRRGHDLVRLQLSARLFENLAESAEEGDAAEKIREFSVGRIQHYRSQMEE